MEDRKAGAAPRRQERESGQGERTFLRAGDAPRPDAPTREELEAANVAY
jgi:hypothetical protein